jgi:hypothetical protein
MPDPNETKSSLEITRRDFLATAAAATWLPHLAAGRASASGVPQAAQTSWMDNWPTVIVGSWDDMPIFRRRVGGASTRQEEYYRREHTEETVRKLKELGVTLAIIHFYKGFGLAAERPHINDAIKLAELCHRLEIKVGVYVGSTVAYETFLLETPSAQEWFVPDYLGRPVVYGEQTFRKRVYFMHPGYREYMKRVLRVAVEEVKADLIHFDNTSMQAEPAIFQHPLAIEDFRRFLAVQHTPEALERRFGFRDPKYVLPPQVDWTPVTINDPLFQEWTDFRCQTLSRYYEEMAAFIHSLNPAVAVENNPHSGLGGVNTYWLQGVDYPRLLAHTQAVWTEEGDEAAVTPAGVLVSKIRTYKMAAQLHNRIFTYTGISYGGPKPNEAQMKLEMAEAMAYNRQCLGMVGGILSIQKLPESGRRYIRFFRENFQLYRGVESAAEVAVLHCFASLAFNNDRPYQSTWLFEQTLIQARIPFDIIFDRHLKDLSRYRVLILADQEALSDEQITLLRRYVQGGGGLVATEWTSFYNEWREVRPGAGLGDFFNFSPPESAEEDSVPTLLPEEVRNLAGGGRVVYIPAVRPAIPKPSGGPMTSSLWKLPLNFTDLTDALRLAAGGNLPIEVQAPPTVTVELLRQKESGSLLLHLVNYANERTPSPKDIQVRVDARRFGPLRRVSWRSPDRNETLELAATVGDDHIVFTVPWLETYGVAVLSPSQVPPPRSK